MSSQGSSSAEIYSVATFAAMAGDPLSKEVSTPSILFTEFILEVSSRSVDEGVTGPTSELASTSGSVSEEEEVAVSYADLQSMLSMEDSVRMVARYDLEVLMPYELEGPRHPPAGYVTLSETYLKFGVRFPLHLFSWRSSSISGSPFSR